MTTLPGPVPVAAPAAGRARRFRPSLAALRLSPLARREAKFGYLFIAPWLIGFFVFTLAPMVASLVFTFTNLSLEQAQPLAFVGLRNWITMLNDNKVWESLGVTFKFALLMLPVAMLLPFLLALGLNSRSVKGASAFRVLFFLPYVIPFVSGVLIWQGMLNPETGWINAFLGFLGVQNPPNWLNDTATIYPALVFIGIWGIGAGIIVNLAGLRSIPSELYDAARIDGAGYWAQLRNVTVPMMSPVIFYTLILGIVEVLQYFLVPLVINNGTGEPGGTTSFFNLYLYKTFFTYQNMAYGATLAWLLFLVTLIVSLVVFRSSRRWVYYAGER
ncbi:MAG TPA: sugar ABC transporter permease [Candidatus Limnocylindrales bacterium]|nr:sugar ABC transporter permease [Candidatus Limnocylindrales bacterium]